MPDHPRPGAPTPRRADGSIRAGRFTRLPDAPPLALDAIIARIPAALAAAAEPCRVAVEGAMDRHGAFVRFLMVATGTRRYAELGTYHGRSLFSAAQAARHITPAPECIGIDSWVGDRHTGQYPQQVGARTQRVASTAFPASIVTVQATFDDARPLFDDGSVDLLLIDGLHTYDAVRHDMETWRGVLSGRGIVMLHDSVSTNPDFAVGRYVAELRAEFPTLEIRHTEGLAVVFVGHVDTPLRTLLESLAQQPELGDAFEALTLAMGTTSASLGEADHIIDMLARALDPTDHVAGPDLQALMVSRAERLSRHGAITAGTEVWVAHGRRARFLSRADRLWVRMHAAARWLSRRRPARRR